MPTAITPPFFQWATKPAASRGLEEVSVGPETFFRIIDTGEVRATGDGDRRIWE